MPKTVLIVDDEPDVCLLLSYLLKKMDFIPETVSSLETARRKVDSSVHDIYFIDVNLPDGVGLQLIPSVKKQSPSSKIIVISAHEAEYQKVSESSADFFIHKPFGKKNILQAFKSMKII